MVVAVKTRPTRILVDGSGGVEYYALTSFSAVSSPIFSNS